MSFRDETVRGKRAIVLSPRGSEFIFAVEDFNDELVAAGNKIPGNFKKFEDTKANRKLYPNAGPSFRDYTPLGMATTKGKPYFFVTFNETKEEYRDYYEHEIAFVYNRFLEKFGKEEAEKYIAEDRNIEFYIKQYGVDPRKYLED